MKQMVKKKIIRLKRFNMKKLIILILFCSFFLVGCSIFDITGDKPTEEKVEDGSKEKDPDDTEGDKTGDDDPDETEGDQTGEDDPNNTEGDKTGDDDPDETEGDNSGDDTEDQNEELSFLEDDFKYEITILNKENYKKVFKSDNYLDFYNVIKDFKYEKFEQCTSCTEVLYTIKYNDNVISVYEYNFFKINDELFSLTSGSFDFLKDYEYTNSESSGWLPWI